MRSLILAVVCLAATGPAAAEVPDNTANGFAVRNVARVAAPPRVDNTLRALHVLAPQKIRATCPLCRSTSAGQRYARLVKTARAE